MTPRPEVPTLTERERYMMTAAWVAARETGIQAIELWLDGNGMNPPHEASVATILAMAAPQTPAPALLTPAQVDALTRAVETSDPYAANAAMAAVLGTDWYNFASIARWLLAAHARVGGGA
jgi:hypothetical protein